MRWHSKILLNWVGWVLTVVVGVFDVVVVFFTVVFFTVVFFTVVFFTGVFFTGVIFTGVLIVIVFNQVTMRVGILLICVVFIFAVNFTTMAAVLI